MNPAFGFSPDGVKVRLPFTGTWTLPLVPASLRFRDRSLSDFAVEQDEILPDRRILRGKVAGTDLNFEGKWQMEAGGWLTFRLGLHGTPSPGLGPFEQLTLLDLATGADSLHSDLGWRELASTKEVAQLMERPPEEGGGLLPPYGYPVFGPDFFLGLAHPMSCAEVTGNHARLFHHPTWSDAALRSASLVIGVCRPEESAGTAFSRYMNSIRRPQPKRAFVEVNTFWTDLCEDGVGYRTDLASYRAFAEGWACDVLAGQSDLVSHILLDAGWQDPSSLYRPQSENGGPSDDALGKLGRDFQDLGLGFGLWFSVNGPIGANPDWAQSAGYRISNLGTGAGYACNRGQTRYICLTDRRWEEDLSARLEELIDRTPVTFFKGDWDNDAIEDPAGSFQSAEQLREANANAMIRIYRRMHLRRPDVALRGAWWLSPWWFQHVDNTHLPNSGDMESCDIPSLTQRDSSLTCRDAVYHHVMVRCQSPVPWDVLCPHEFASSRRNPVQDTADSWMNNLALWASRGSQYLQLYLAPYGLKGWKAWSIREILRWFRAHEDILWKAGTRMVGGDPLSGAVYGFLHEHESVAILTLRNPLAHPQTLPDLAEWGLPTDDWEETYPCCQPFVPRGYHMASHEVLILTRGLPSAGSETCVNSHTGWLQPAAALVPPLHDLGKPRAGVEYRSDREIAIHATLPYNLDSAEIILALRSDREIACKAGVGRYPDGTATFAVPVTHVRPHWQTGYAHSRLRAAKYDPRVSVLRIPVGIGGEAHCFLQADTSLPEILGGWIEGRPTLIPANIQPTVLRPPATSNPAKCLVVLSVGRKSRPQ